MGMHSAQIVIALALVVAVVYVTNVVAAVVQLI